MNPTRASARGVACDRLATASANCVHARGALASCKPLIRALALSGLSLSFPILLGGFATTLQVHADTNDTLTPDTNITPTATRPTRTKIAANTNATTVPTDQALAAQRQSHPTALTTLTAADPLPISADSALLATLPAPVRFVDSREATACRDNTLASALCLPLEDIFADQHRLANFSGLFWLLGTANLTGSETVIVIGDSLQRKRTLAGWLYASGQAHVVVDNASLHTRLAQSNSGNGDNPQQLPTAPGQARATTRTSVFTAIPRTHTLLTRSEIIASLAISSTEARPSATQLNQPITQRTYPSKNTSTTQPLPLFDGRTESEYWGRRIRGSRGGHIPGAVLLDSTNTTRDLPNQTIVTYGHDAREGFALLAQLTSLGVDTQVYLNGWAEWSSHSGLPADAEAFLSAASPAAGTRQSAEQHSRPATSLLQRNSSLLNSAVWMVLALTLLNFAGVIFLGIRQRQYR